ncbi:MAG: hypothetical protein GX288_12040 [Clostridiales bacterium]|nr:hypothetical protein [Clostridiales bacterium]
MVIVSENFNLQQIADSGQCFRMNEIGKDRYGLVAYGRYIELEQVDYDKIWFSCSEDEYQAIWKSYFDMDYDYNSIVQSLKNGEDEFLAKAAAYGSGIRILRQEPFEMLISFIISQNKNIPSIKKCIEGLCTKYGEKRISQDCGGKEYYTFPAAEVLASANKEDLRELKLGYRDQYVINGAKFVTEGQNDLNKLKDCSHEEAVSALRTITGVGLKVANCISLFGLHHIEAFPVDVWIKKVLDEVYEGRFDVNLYPGYAGIVQQYMFYYIRNLNM